jgi:hypothetical protein
VGVLAAALSGELMKAAKILAGCTYRPETLNVIGKAFDEAWLKLAPNIEGEALQEEARERLAHAVLVVAKEDSRDPAKLTHEALQIMAMSYGGTWLDPHGKL